MPKFDASNRHGSVSSAIKIDASSSATRSAEMDTPESPPVVRAKETPSPGDFRQAERQPLHEELGPMEPKTQDLGQAQLAPNAVHRQQRVFVRSCDGNVPQLEGVASPI